MVKTMNPEDKADESKTDCPKCKGEGSFPHQIAVDDFEDIPCDLCKGTGKIDDDNSTMNNPFDKLLNNPPELKPTMPFDTMVSNDKKGHIDGYGSFVKPNSSIYERAIYLWGEDAQIRMAIEECGELIVKLAKYGRNHNGSKPEDIVDEIADVEIMMAQLRVIFKEYSVDYAKDLKLNRLKKRVEYGEGTG